MHAHRTTLTLTALTLAAGLALAGCTTTPAAPTTPAPTSTPAVVAAAAPTAAPTPAPTASTDPTLTATYRTHTGGTIRIDPTKPIPADVIADIQRRIPAGVPTTHDGTRPVATAVASAIEAVGAAGRQLALVWTEGTYDWDTGALATTGWGWGMHGTVPGSFTYSSALYPTEAEAHAAALAVIAARPDRAQFDIVDVTA